MKTKSVTLSEAGVEACVHELLTALVPSAHEATVVALIGDLGAGKTTFVKALGKALGITEQITSPTFTIMSRYEVTGTPWQQLLHMDAYRIEDVGELRALRFDELLKSPRTLFCIEWADTIVTALPAKRIELVFENTPDANVRTIHITHLGV